jgi:hypothetical protein
MSHEPIADYLGDDIENIIAEALMFYATSDISPANRMQAEQAEAFATALENDTWLLQTTTPPAEEYFRPTGAERERRS